MRPLSVGLFLLVCASAFSQTTLNCNFTPLPLPGNFNIAYGVNDAGSIVGDIIIGDGSAQGFLLSATRSNVFSISGATQTIPADINNLGQVVGSYTDSGQVNHGFLFGPTGLSIIDYPGQGQNPSTGVTAINDGGTIVGIFGIYFGTGSSQGSFLLQDGQFTPITFPDAVITNAASLNNAGEVVGVYATLNSDNSLFFHGFQWIAGLFTSVDYPGATSTSLTGINDSGTITGFYADAIGHNHSFILEDGRFLVLSPATVGTVQVYGINNKDEIVGLDIGATGNIKSVRATCPI